MGLRYFNNYSKNLKKDYYSRNNPIDVWRDIFNYSANLPGNWLFSKHIFYSYILPTAEKNPAKFAKWIRAMVKKSGIKIKSNSEFVEALNHLSRIKGKDDRSEIKKALYYLLDSGLEEPEYAQQALLNSKVI